MERNVVSEDGLTLRQNIEKAKKEIERLEKEATEASTSSPPPKAGGRRQDRVKKVGAKDTSVNHDVPADAEPAQEQDAVGDVEKELKGTSIEDKENGTVAAAT